MAVGTTISTWFDGSWHDGDVPVMRAADHGAWLGTMVFDGARTFDGHTPDLDLHCARIIRSARAMGLNPPVTGDEIEALVRERLGYYAADMPLYIRPMMWSTGGMASLIEPDPDQVGFAICIEDMPMNTPADYGLGLSTICRPTANTAVTDAKAACHYANNGRIMREARLNGFHNALSMDQDGFVAETASSNAFLVRDGEIMTPKANGTFLAGITRMRVIDLLKQGGVTVTETSLAPDAFDTADEIFLTANAAKIIPVTRYCGRTLGKGQMTTRIRTMYWDYAHTQS